MAGGNTIGTGAVVLTANADNLLAGLDKAYRATDKWASANRKAYDSLVSGGAKLSGYMDDVDYSKGIGPGKKGGPLSGLFGGASIGGGMLGAAGLPGLALAGVGAGLTAITKSLEVGVELAGAFVDRLSQVGERAKLYSNIDPFKQEGIDRTTAAFDRIGAAIDDFFFSAAGDLAPMLEKIADVVEVIGFVGAEAFGELVDVVGDVITSIAQWVDELTGLSTASTSAGDQAFAVLKNLGVGAAYVWDTMKAGAGALVYVGAQIGDVFGEVLKVIVQAAKQLDAFAQELPEAIRPEWIGKAADAMERYGTWTENFRAGAKQWGLDALNGFGDSAGKIEGWFDRMQAKFDATERLQKVTEAKWDGGGMLGGAFSKNTTEAYSVMAKFQGGNMIADGQRRMEGIALKQLDALREIEKKVEPLLPG